jgi:hypothetical protein
LDDFTTQGVQLRALLIGQALIDDPQVQRAGFGMGAQRTDCRDHPWKKVRIATRDDDLFAQTQSPIASRTPGREDREALAVGAREFRRSG